MHRYKYKRPKANNLNMRTNTGFTLIELSIVIVIIGLIVAGVVGGQSIVKQAKLRGIVSDINKYNIAFNSFKLEYDAIPGDFNRATSYWGGAVQDGDGDKAIDSWPSDERLGFWEHLQEAGLISGSLSGDNVAGAQNVIGVNVPQSAFSDDAGFAFQTPHGTIHDVNGHLAGNKSLAFMLGSGP